MENSINNFYRSYFHLLLFVLLFAPRLSFSQGFSPVDQEHFQAVIDNFVNDNDNPWVGGIAAAIKIDGLAMWTGASGYASRNIDAASNLLPGGTPFTTDTLSRIYSITKTFTSALVLELVHQGELRLDDRAGNYIPLCVINSELSDDVTIRQLLGHESGFSDYTDEFNFQVAVAYMPDYIWSPYEIISFVHKINEVGAVRSYSSTNYIILGAIIEVATGKPVEQLYRERFFKPLHLKSMYLAVRESMDDRGSLASPHDNLSPFNPVFAMFGKPLFPDEYTNLSRFPFTGIASAAFTGGGIVSNIEDLVNWGSALFNGRATSQFTLNTMLNSIPDMPDEDGDYLGYGLMGNYKIHDMEFFLGHNGRAFGYRSAMFHQPEKNVTIAVLTNFAGADVYEISKELYKMVPDFICGKKEDKIQICLHGHEVCVAKAAANTLLKHDAYLGSCENNEWADNNMPKHEKLKDKFIAYPNPFDDRINLYFMNGSRGLVCVKIYDMQGKPLNTLFEAMSEEAETHTLELNRKDFHGHGVYFLKLFTPDGITCQRLMLVD